MEEWWNQKTNKSNYYIKSYHSEGVGEKSCSKNVGNNVLPGYYKAKDRSDYT